MARIVAVGKIFGVIPLALFGIDFIHRAVWAIDDFYVVKYEKFVLRAKIRRVAHTAFFDVGHRFFGYRARAFFVNLTLVNVVNIAKNDYRNICGKGV